MAGEWWSSVDLEIGVLSANYRDADSEPVVALDHAAVSEFGQFSRSLQGFESLLSVRVC